MTLKSYFALAVEERKIITNPAKVVKLIPLIKSPPRQISDSEESAIVSAVTNYGSDRDRTIIILMFHTGLRSAEVCRLRCEHIHLRKRSGYLEIYGKRNKYRERTCPHLVPLNATVRKVLLEYLTTIEGYWLFISRKTKSAITTTQRFRVVSLAKQDDGTFVPPLGYLVGKYARRILATRSETTLPDGTFPLELSTASFAPDFSLLPWFELC